jgi:hypothetical protein
VHPLANVKRVSFFYTVLIHSPVIIKQHYCGIAIAYEPKRLRVSDEPAQKISRPQGSRYSQQKRKVADAVEWMRKNGEHKPLIFVATSPGFTKLADESKLISKLTANLRNGYGVKNYVWVREYTEAGFPHFHFVADTDFIDAKQLSVYWSGLFGKQGDGYGGSIRLGTKPVPGMRRKYFIDSPHMAFYMSKYFGKGMSENPSNTKPGIEGMEVKARKPRTFHVSRDLASASAPLKFGEYISEVQFTGMHQREFVLENETSEDYYERGEIPPTLNPYKYNWQFTGHGMTYIGRPKSWKRKTKPSGVGSTGQ